MQAGYRLYKPTTTDSTGNFDVMGKVSNRMVAIADRTLRQLAVTGTVMVAVALSGCATTVTKHGQLFQDSDLQQIAPGMTQEQVKLSLGTPTTTATAGTANAYYYISSTMTQNAFNLPSEVDRKVVAVYFTQAGTVDRVANYGMKDGKVFDAISRTTPSANTNDDGVVKSLFRNLGQKGNVFGGN
jgi:outer membrane protein assembly factor BamE (lipoprotein component of BamABCDE complex)